MTPDIKRKLDLIEETCKRKWGVAGWRMLSPRDRNLWRSREALLLLAGQESLRGEFASELVAAVLDQDEEEA